MTALKRKGIVTALTHQHSDPPLANNERLCPISSALVSHITQIELVQLILEPVSERNHSKWVVSGSKSVHKKRNRI